MFLSTYFGENVHFGIFLLVKLKKCSRFFFKQKIENCGIILCVCIFKQICNKINSSLTFAVYNETACAVSRMYNNKLDEIVRIECLITKSVSVENLWRFVFYQARVL